MVLWKEHSKMKVEMTRGEGSVEIGWCRGMMKDGNGDMNKVNIKYTNNK